MNQRLISVLAFALVVSGAASLLLYRLLAGRMPAQSASSKVSLLVAARNLEPGALIKDTDIREDEWSASIPEGAIRIRDAISGRGVISTILANEPFVETRLALKGEGAGLATLIPKGMRAVAIRVNEVVGVAGFAVPGMRVDVLVSGSLPGGTAGGVTETLLQNVEVLSAGQNFQKDAEGKPVSVQVVNLLVTPEQAEKLSLASNQTTIQLVLRNPLDTEIAKTPGSAVAELFRMGLESAPAGRVFRPTVVDKRPSDSGAGTSARAPSKPMTPVVQVLHGSKLTEVHFEPRPEVRP